MADTAETPKPAPPAQSAAQKGEPTYVPGPPIPSKRLPEKAEFSPVFDPPVTHDLRTEKPEEKNAAALEPLDPSSPDPLKTLTEMVTVPRREWERLQTQADLNVIAADLPASEVPAAEAEKILAVFREGVLGTETPAASVPQAAVAAVRTSIPDAESAAPKRRRRRWVIPAAIMVTGALCILVYSKGRAKGLEAGRAAAKAAAVERRGYFPAIGGFNRNVFEYARSTQNNLRWITTDPINPYIWTIVGQLTKAGRKVQVVAVGDVVGLEEVKTQARATGAELWVCQVRLKSLNLVQIDQAIQIDGSNDTAVYGTSDPKDIALWNRDVGRQLFNSATKVVGP